MKKIGLTGGIGSGKSTVAEIFSRLGVPVFNSDNAARQLQEENEELINGIIKLFGSEIYAEKKLNRTKVAEIVFADKNKLNELNKIVHPAVGKAFEKFCEENKESKYILKEAAILFEIGDEKNLDKMIVVTAPDELRIKRVMNRDGSTFEHVQKRIKNQISQEEKASKADFTLVNDEIQLLLPQVLKLHEQLIKN